MGTSWFGDIYLNRRMLMAGFHFPLQPIIRELLAFLQLSSFQVLPNGWRLFLGSYVVWPMIHPGDTMSLSEIFTIYRPLFKDSRTMSFVARGKLRLVWVDSKGPYSNNKHWDQEFFYVSG